MIILFLFILISFILGLIFILIGYLVNFYSFKDREKISSFECGFDSSEFFRNPFSIRFFLVSVQFLIFDIEIALIVPLIKIFEFSNLVFFSLLGSFIFLIIITIGFIHE